MTLMEGFAREIGRALDHALAFELQDEMVERLGVLDRAKNDFLVGGLAASCAVRSRACSATSSCSPTNPPTR